MRRFFELMARDPDVAGYFVSHVVATASAMVVHPPGPIELPFWLAPRTEPLSPSVLIQGDRTRAKALQVVDIEGLWTDGEQGQVYVGYSHGEPCIRIVLNAQEDALEFTFL